MIIVEKAREENGVLLKGDFFLNCDLEYINSILVDYGEKEYKNDDPGHLHSVLMSLLGIH